MNDFENLDDLAASTNKPTYIAPKISKLGSLTELTQGGFGMYADFIVMVNNMIMRG